MVLILSIMGGLILIFAVAGVVCYRLFAVPAMRPLSVADRALCARIVGEGRGIFWVCRHALKSGQCPCQPCAMLQGARGEGRCGP